VKYSEIVGRPYAELNCWEVAREFYRIEFGIELKHFPLEDSMDKKEIEKLIYSNQGDFDKVETPQFGDLILLKISGIESHIAVYLGAGKMLHTMISTGCVIDRVHKWDKTISGFYRLGGQVD
jgi:cell wall-associated NlpC family hydrolase